jgi:hypothetical protein
VIGIHSLQGCRSVHISVTIITIGLWKPRGKKRGYWSVSDQTLNQARDYDFSQAVLLL